MTRPAPPPCDDNATHAKEYYGYQFDVPWSIWGGEWAESSEVMVGTIDGFRDGKFTLTFPPSANTDPDYLTWDHLLGEAPWHGQTLKPRQPTCIDGASSGAGLSVGARHFIDRPPQKAARRPLPQPFRLLSFGDIARGSSPWIGNTIPSSAQDDDSFLPDELVRFRELLRSDTITCWTQAEIDHPIHFFEQYVQ